MARSPLRIEADKLVKAMPTAGNRTIARRLAKEFKCTVEQARNIVRVAVGAHGKHNRKFATIKKPLGKAGTKPQCPPSLAEPWTDYILDARRVLVLSDIHVPYHDTKALVAAVNHGHKLDPDAILINGDLIDYYSISRYLKDPRKRDLKKEMAVARETLHWLMCEFPKAKRVFKAGNHDERWDHYLWNNAPEICDDPRMRLDVWLELEKMGWDYVSDQRPVMLGKLPVFHGHELPKGMTNPVNQARGAFLRMVATSLTAHGHRTSNHTEPNWRHEEIATWSQGCLCDLYPQYAPINKWNHGFAFVEVHSNGEFDLHNLRITDGKVRQS